MDIEREYVLQFLNDAVPYMKVVKMLKDIYFKMIHITYAAHDLHRVVEEIRGKFKSVDKVITSVKKLL